MTETSHTRFHYDPRVSDDDEGIRPPVENETPQFWGVYEYGSDGMAQHLTDCHDEDSARDLCDRLNADWKVREGLLDALKELVRNAQPSGPLWFNSEPMILARAAISAATKPCPPNSP